jgi:Fe2+ or Zn2+ uptake regulation protein
MQSPDALTDRFRANGRKITAQRQCIFRALEGDVTHPSAERVHERVRHDMPNISLKTVYQTLNDLAELGAIAVLDVGTGSARFDPNVEHAHHHLVCRSCGKVRDIDADFPGLRVPRRASQGFEVDGAEVVFRGLCEDCRGLQRSAPTAPKSNRRAPTNRKGINRHASIEGQPDRGQPEGSLRRREPGQPPLPLLRPEG